MRDWKDITKEEFDMANLKYPPNKWTEFAFRYFSKNRKPKDSWVGKTVQNILIGLFLVGFVGTVLDIPKVYIAIPVFIFTGSLIALAILISTAMIMNNIRIKRIRKFLGVTNDEYNALVDKFE